MISKELYRRIRKIQIVTRRLVDETFAGEYVSVFRGRGMEFSEVREYQPGDDVRSIDWNVTARMGRPFIKRYEEERELTVMLMVDASPSGEFGSADQLKGEIAAEISAIIAFSAVTNNDRVGLIIFTDHVEKYLPPAKGQRHVLRLIRELLHFRPEGTGTDIGEALDFLGRVQKRKAVCFLVSDFQAAGFEKSLQIANKRHDLIAVSVTDPREMDMPDVGMADLEDAETGEIVTVDTSDPRFREQFRAAALSGRRALSRTLKGLSVDSVEVVTDKPYIEPLTRFFKERAHRFR